MEKKIALIMGGEICYGYPDFCLKQIAATLERLGYTTELYSVIDNEFFDKRWDAVIGINQPALSVCLENGEFIFDQMDCPLFEMIMDPPYHLHEILRKHPKNMHLICLDEGHIQFSKKYYGSFQSVEMGYFLGNVQNGKPFHERQIDILFSGNLVNLDEFSDGIKQYEKPWITELFSYLIEFGKKYPNIAMDKTVLAYFKARGMAISEEDYKMAMEIVGTMAEYWLRGFYRQKIMRTLMNAGIPITVVGPGWESFQEKYPELFHWNGRMEYKEMNKLMADAKILLNVMPWFKDGLHDRIPASMHCGAVCVTDGSSYINSHFSDGENIVLYDLAELERLPGKILYLLEDEDIAAKIAQNGYEKVNAEYTWEKMVEDCILKYVR